MVILGSLQTASIGMPFFFFFFFFVDLFQCIGRKILRVAVRLKVELVMNSELPAQQHQLKQLWC